MKESFPNAEQLQPKIEKQTVIDAYKPFIDSGATDIDELRGTHEGDPEFEKAEELYFAWAEQGQKEAQENPADANKISFENTLFFLDIGFTGKDYARDALHDWCLQDIDNEGASEKPDREWMEMAEKKLRDYSEKLLPGEEFPEIES